MNHAQYCMCVVILSLGLAILMPGPEGHAAPLPAPKKMSLPPPTEVHLNSLKRWLNSKLERCNSKPEEREWAKNYRYDYYLDAIGCIQEYLEGRSRYPFERSLTTEERRGLRDLLYRLQREMAEGQANGTVGHEGFHEVWRRHKEAQRQKQK